MNYRVGTLPDRFRYLVVLSRPRFWLYTFGPVLVGAVYGASTTGDLTTTSVLVLAVYFLFPANVLLYGVNDIFDADIDAVNPRKKSGGTRATGEAGKARDTGATQEAGEARDTGATQGAGEARDTGATQEAGEARDTGATQEAGGARDTGATQEAGGARDTGATQEAGEARDTGATQEVGEARDARETQWRGDPFVIAAILASGLFGIVTFWVTPRVAWPFLAGFFGLAVAYSAPPLRLKTVPLLDSMANGLYILPGAGAYAALAGAHPPIEALLGAWLWTMGMHTFSAIPDIDADRRAGIRTTATVLGERRTYWYCGLAWILAWLAFTGIDVRLGAPFLVYPVLVTVIARDEIPVSRAYWWFPALNAGVGALITIGGLVILRSGTGGILP